MGQLFFNYFINYRLCSFKWSLTKIKISFLDKPISALSADSKTLQYNIIKDINYM